MIKQILYFSLILIVFQACRSKTNQLDIPGYELEPEEIEISDEAMGDIIENVSSPIEMAALIKDLGVPYDTRLLTDPSDYDNYTTSFRLAYGLGMLGADLGYLNVYEKTGSAVSYLTEINKLADGLKVSRFFDFNTIKRLATSNNNIDSLMFLSVHSFNEMDKHLRKTNRSSLSALMIAGLWIEGMYQVTQVAKKNPDPLLVEYIGEQKIILNDLLIILENYKNDQLFAGLIRDYELVKEVFNEVNISYEMSDPQPVEKDGMLMVVQDESSVVSVSEATLEKIIESVESVRDKRGGRGE